MSDKSIKWLSTELREGLHHVIVGVNSLSLHINVIWNDNLHNHDTACISQQSADLRIEASAFILAGINTAEVSFSKTMKLLKPRGDCSLANLGISPSRGRMQINTVIINIYYAKKG